MNELVTHPTKTLAAIAGVFGAFVLLVGAIRKDKIAMRWARQATAVAAVLFLLYCFSSLALIVLKPSIPSYRYDQALLIKTVVGCTGAGMLIAVAMSGSYRRVPKPEAPR